jgi:ribosomal protein S18 acetylase RimI-like enzyme
VTRLLANGFRDMGMGLLMALADPGPAHAFATRDLPPGVTVERYAGLTDEAASRVAPDIVEVIVDAFDIGGERLRGIRTETEGSLAHPWFTHYLVRLDGRPAAVTRRGTFDGMSYLSSIGTAGWARGRGLGRIVTAAATRDAVGAGSAWTYLGVFVDNRTAIRLYEAVGFERVGEPCPDLLLV